MEPYSALIAGATRVGAAAVTAPPNQSSSSALFTGGFQGLGNTDWVVNFGNKSSGAGSITDTRGNAASGLLSSSVGGIPAWLFIAGGVALWFAFR